MSWKHKEQWLKQGKHFAVKIVRWSFGIEPYDNNWNVYAIVYPTHPLFKRLPTNHSGLFGFIEETLEGFEELFHCGITYNEPHYVQREKPWHHNKWYHKLLKLFQPKTKLVSREIGSDYLHLHDDRFKRYATLGEAAEVKADAEKLFNYLKEVSE